MKYRVSAPSKGFDAFAQVDFLPTRYFNMYLRYRLGDKEQDFVDKSLPTRQILNYEKQSAGRKHPLRLHIRRSRQHIQLSGRLRRYCLPAGHITIGPADLDMRDNSLIGRASCRERV